MNTSPSSPSAIRTERRPDGLPPTSVGRELRAFQRFARFATPLPAASTGLPLRRLGYPRRFRPRPVCALDAPPLASCVGCRRHFWGTAVPRERRENGGRDTPERHRLSAASVQAGRRPTEAKDELARAGIVLGVVNKLAFLESPDHPSFHVGGPATSGTSHRLRRPRRQPIGSSTSRTQHCSNPYRWCSRRRCLMS